MKRYADWLWRRFRRHYVVALLTTVTVSATLSLGAPGTAFLIVIYGNIPGVWATAGTGLSLLIGFAIAVATFSAKEHEPLRRWGRNEAGGDPTELMDALLSLPEIFATRFLKVGLAPSVLAAAAVATWTIDASWLVFVGAVFGVGLVAVMAVLIMGVSLRLLLAPVVAEVTPVLPDYAGTTHRGWSLPFRLLSVVGLLMMSGVMVGAAWTRGIDDLNTLYVLAEITGIVWGLYAVMLVRATVVNPSLEPLRDLEAGVRRVAAGTFDERVAITSADEFGRLAVAFNDMQRGLRERESLQAAFGSYVDPALAERILEQGNSLFDGEEIDVTVFFADVRGFTTYAAARSAQEAVARLNELFALVVPIIRDNGGHANTYAGDGVLAVFGTPAPLARHADAAVAAAIEMQRAVYATFGDELRIGIGINTGSVIAGTIGGGGKLEFTVIGDAVNVASRIEALTKETGDDILLAQATLDQLVSVPTNLSDRGEFEIRGKSDCVHLHTIGSQ